jgi:hypothetical protein
MNIRSFWRAMCAIVTTATVAVALGVTGSATAVSIARTPTVDPLDGPCAMSLDGVPGSKIEVSGPSTTGTVVVLDTTTNTYVAVDVVIAGSEVHFYRAGTTDPIAVTFCIKAGPSNTGPVGPATSGSTAGVLVNDHGTPLAISHVVVYTATSTSRCRSTSPSTWTTPLPGTSCPTAWSSTTPDPLRPRAWWSPTTCRRARRTSPRRRRAPTAARA